MLEDFEASRAQGEPVELYFFRYGTSALDFYAYTDSEKPITVTLPIYGAVEFQPLPIAREAIKSSGTLDKAAITVTLPRDAEVAELFRVYPPTQSVSLFIRHGHRGDPDSEFLVVWAGRVLSCKFMHSEAELTCEPIATAMRRAILRRHYQYGCPHVLYMGNELGGCRADKVAATRSTTVTAIPGATQIQLPSGWNGGFGKLKFRNGMAEWVTPSGSVERRTVLQINEATNVITLSGVVRHLEIAGDVDIILGCDHQMDGDCKNLHNNVPDYGGQPWIPIKNPFKNTNNYY